MIAHVVPYRRTPRGTEYFDYAIPDGLTLERGDTVWIPLRKQTIAGLVVRTVDGSADGLKPIGGLTEQQYWQSNGRVDLLEWFAAHYGVSLPTAWKTMQFPLLKRPRAAELPRTAHGKSPEHTAVKSSAILLTNRSGDELAQYARFASHGRTLIIAPERERVHHIASRLTHPHIVAFDEDPSPSAYAALAQHIAGNEHLVVVGTKKMLFLEAPWDRVVVDQEHAKSHKQYDSNPRYHVPTVAQRLSCPAIFSSPAPSVARAHAGLETLDKRSQWNPERIELINMNEEYDKGNATWFSERLVELVGASSRAFLFLNRTGEYTVAVCMDCDELLQATASMCGNCRSNNIVKRGRGVASLEGELRERFPDRRVVRVDRTVEVTTQELNAAQIIIGTEKVFRVLDLATLDSIGVLSVDHLLLYPHFQANERVWQLLSEMAIAGPPVLIQTHSPQHGVLQALKKNDVEGFWKSELSARKMLSLPPFEAHIRLIDPRTGQARVERGDIDFGALDPRILVDRSE